MTSAQRTALSFWSMYAQPGFPIVKLGRKWTIETGNGVWAVIGTNFPLFATKTAACEFFNNLVLQRSREWRAEAEATESIPERVRNAQYTSRRIGRNL